MLIISLKLGGGGWCYVVLEKMMTQKRGELRVFWQGRGWVRARVCECVCWCFQIGIPGKGCVWDSLRALHSRPLNKHDDFVHDDEVVCLSQCACDDNSVQIRSEDARYITHSPPCFASWHGSLPSVREMNQPSHNVSLVAYYVSLKGTGIYGNEREM